MSRRVAIDWVTGRSFGEMELLTVRLNVQSGHHKLSAVEERPPAASGARGDRAD